MCEGWVCEGWRCEDCVGITVSGKVGATCCGISVVKGGGGVGSIKNDRSYSNETKSEFLISQPLNLKLFAFVTLQIPY